MSKLYITYYTILALFTAAMASQTIYLGSLHVASGHTIRNLQTQRTQLDTQILSMKQELGQQISSQAVKEKAVKLGFQTIETVDQIDLTQVASSR